MMSDDATLENFLRDFLTLIIERAKEAKQLWKSAKERGDLTEDLSEGGRALAYYEVLSALVNEAETFGLSKERIPELAFEPDKELLS